MPRPCEYDKSYAEFVIEDEADRRQKTLEILKAEMDWPCTNCPLNLPEHKREKCGHKCIAWREWFAREWSKECGRLRPRYGKDDSSRMGRGKIIIRFNYK